MYKFRVTLNSVGTLTASVDIQAETQDEAEEKALKSLSFLEWTVIDIDPEETFVSVTENLESPELFV